MILRSTAFVHFETDRIMDIDELKSELQELKDEKYHLLKLINHDIRSPFNRLYALLQLLELDSGDITPRQNEYISSMYLTILSSLEMIQNLKDMREIDAGKVEIIFSEADPDELIRNAIRSFSKQEELKKIHIKYAPTYSAPAIISDAYYLQRVIENVLSNALKFSRSEKEITVDLKQTNGLCQIGVRDFGEGIKSSEATMLYNKFQKLSSFATGGEGSLGLGLYNAQYFARLLGGSISLNPEVQPGSYFLISVPVSRSI